MLNGKNIVIGVSGGIAAYKVVDVVSRLKKLNANINVIMTNSAEKFVTPLTFQTLSQNLVITNMFAEPKTWDVKHISLAEKADLLVVAPATANIIGKIANGIADDMLTTTIMATKAQILIIPAMNKNMYENPIVQKNIEILKKSGYIFMEPAMGRLACGDYGKGKLPDPENIVSEIVNIFNIKKDLVGKRILITAGPTQEPIDPVRYITNHSSGKMGYAIAKCARNRGAEVILISGPANLQIPLGIKVINVATAREMYNEVLNNIDKVDIIIKAAAVADYRPKVVSDEKIKKQDGNLIIELERNPDILYEIGKIKKDKVLVGFAAETSNLIKNAKDKLKNKNLDLIVANDLTKEGAGFKEDTNIVSIINKEGNVEKISKMKKDEIADILLDKVIDLMNKE